MSSFVEYNGAESVYTLGRTWRPNDRISVSDLCKDFGERAGDTSGGDIFINWLSSKLQDKPKFSLHIDSTDLAGLVERSKEGGKETVESGPIAVASSAKAAAESLRTHGQQVSDQPNQQAGHIQESTGPEARTKRSTKRLSSVKAVKEALQQESQPMTGDMLDVQHSRDTAGAASDSFVAQPAGSSQQQTSNVQPSPVIMANPQPSLSPSNKVSTGREGVITNLPEVTDDPANIVPQDRRTETTVNKVSLESDVITGDDLTAEGDPGATAAPETATSEASAIGGKKRPAFQGTVGVREVTLDHIVRAGDFNKAIDAVNQCKDRRILNVAKSQLANSGGAQRVIDKIESRIQALKKRGM